MKYTGACHCKKVSYEVQMEIDKAISCNCSHCQAKGLLLSFTTADKFTLLSGEDNLTSYKFNKEVIDHLFCKTCGVQAFSKGKDPEGNATVAINVRTLNGIETDDLEIMKVDGKSW